MKESSMLVISVTTKLQDKIIWEHILRKSIQSDWTHWGQALKWPKFGYWLWILDILFTVLQAWELNQWLAISKMIQVTQIEHVMIPIKQVLRTFVNWNYKIVSRLSNNVKYILSCFRWYWACSLNIKYLSISNPFEKLYKDNLSSKIYLVGVTKWDMSLK